MAKAKEKEKKRVKEKSVKKPPEIEEKKKPILLKLLQDDHVWKPYESQNKTKPIQEELEPRISDITNDITENITQNILNDDPVVKEQQKLNEKDKQWQQFQEIMSEEVIVTQEIPPKPKEDADLNQLQNIQVSTNIASLRRHLNMKLSTWATIMLILSDGSVSIHGMPQNQSTDVINQNIFEAIPNQINPISSPETQKREIFKPMNIDSTKGPLFDLTQKEELVEIDKGNFSLTIETFHKNPYIKSSIDIPTKTYKLYTQVIDTSEITVEAHNSILFMENHNKNKEYKESLGFKSMPNTKSNKTWDNFDKIDPFHLKKEYCLYPNKIGYQDCNLVCPLMDAKLPENPKQIQEASRIFNSTGHIWIDSTQITEKRSSWSWDHIYNYQINWDHKQIYPITESNIFQKDTTCQAYKNNQPISHQEIGYKYSYYKDNTYHTTEAYRLEVCVDEDLKCRVIRPNSDELVSNEQDNNICVCQRDQTKDTMKSNQMEAEKLQTRIKSLFPGEIIEEWRYKTLTQNTILEDIDNTLRPRYTKIDKKKIKKLEKRYLSKSDLTNLKIETTKGRDLKAKDIGKYLATKGTKLVASNPTVLLDFHKNWIKKATPETNIDLVQTREIIGNDEQFAEIMNTNFPHFSVEKNVNMIKIHPLIRSNEWPKLGKIITDKQAAQGLMKARGTDNSVRILRQQFLPNALRNVKIKSTQLIGTTIDWDEMSLIQGTIHPSFVEIRILVPVILKESTRIHHVASLPHAHNIETGEYLSKRLPNSLIMTPGTDLFNTTSKCHKDIVKGVGNLEACPNEEVVIEDINKIMTIGTYNIYLFKNIGELQVSCPNTKLVWFSLIKSINLVFLHSSCYATTAFDLQIQPTTLENNPRDINAIHLMAYDLVQPNWIPKTEGRWIASIVLLIVTGLVLTILCSAISWLLYKKPWYCRVVAATTAATTSKKETKKKEGTEVITSILKEKLETLAKHNSRTQINEEFKENSTYCPYGRDYEQDLLEYMTGSQEKVEDFYATIKKKPHQKISRSHSLDNELSDPKNSNIARSKSTNNTIDEQNFNTVYVDIQHPHQYESQHSPEVHWKFDGNPLNSNIQKKSDKESKSEI